MHLGAIFPQLSENPRVMTKIARVITRLYHSVHDDHDNRNAYGSFYAGGPIPIPWKVQGNYPGVR